MYLMLLIPEPFRGWTMGTMSVKPITEFYYGHKSTVHYNYVTKL